LRFIFIIFVVELQDVVLNDGTKLYVHIFGYAQYIVKEWNEHELRALIGDDLLSCIISLRIEEGKFVVSFYNHHDRMRFRNRMDTLAYHIANSILQLPLITSSNNLRITLTCNINTNMSWDRFMITVSRRNDLNASKWEHIETIQMGQTFQIAFSVDAATRLKIEKRGNKLNYNEEQVEITALENSLDTDRNNLPL